MAADCPTDASGLPSCDERGLEPLSLCVGNNVLAADADADAEAGDSTVRTSSPVRPAGFDAWRSLPFDPLPA